MHRKTSIPWWGIVLLAVLGLGLISPVQLTVIRLNGSGWLAFSEAKQQAVVQNVEPDLDGDGRNECLNLVHSRLTIYRCGETNDTPLWRSPAGWQVKQWMLSDLNHDGKPEITLLVWRKFAPWPVDRYLPGGGGRINDFHDSRGISCHIILVGWQKGGFGELWAGSAMYDPALSIAAADMDGDGVQELITIEGKYQDSPLFRSGPLAVWKWNGFGFDLFDRFNGNFRHVIALTGFPGWVAVSQ